MRNASHLVFVLSTVLAGCATQPGDATGPDGNGGGKADGEDGLHIEAAVTTLSASNVIRWPRAVDTSSTADDIANLELPFELITGENLEQIQRSWQLSPESLHQGVDAADFEVTANQRGVLSLAIHYETQYAYPDTHHVYLNFDRSLGALVLVTDLLDEAALPTLAATLDAALQVRLAQLKSDFAAEIAAGDIDATQWDGLHVTADSLAQYSTTPDGVTFHWDAGFPHALAALAPDGDFEVPFADLQPYVNPVGPWGARLGE